LIRPDSFRSFMMVQVQYPEGEAPNSLPHSSNTISLRPI